MINLINELQNLIKTLKTTIPNIEKTFSMNQTTLQQPLQKKKMKHNLQNVDTDQLQEQRKKKKIKNQLQRPL